MTKTQKVNSTVGKFPQQLDAMRLNFSVVFGPVAATRQQPEANLWACADGESEVLKSLPHEAMSFR